MYHRRKKYTVITWLEKTKICNGKKQLIEKYLWFSYCLLHQTCIFFVHWLNPEKEWCCLCCIICYCHFEKDYDNVHITKLTTTEESCNFELNSRRLLWAWELTVSSLWLAYLFKCSARNLYHVNWGRNFIIITIATAGKFISKQLATWKFSRDGKNSRWYIHFNSFSFIPVLKCSINECKAFFFVVLKTRWPVPS